MRFGGIDLLPDKARLLAVVIKRLRGITGSIDVLGNIASIVVALCFFQLKRIRIDGMRDLAAKTIIIGATLVLRGVIYRAFCHMRDLPLGIAGNFLLLF